MSDTTVTAPRPRAPGADFTIAQWCEHRNISRPTYHQWRLRGLGPKELRIGSVIRITAKADAEWQERMEHQSKAFAREQERIDEMLGARATAAAKKSVKARG
jgi:hypothetical protein